jgi:hypothetical protein
MKFTCINIQGNLISEEVLIKVGEATAGYQSPKDFGLEQQASLRDEIEYAWSRVKLDWRHFSERIQTLPATDPYGTTLSRKWMEQFLSTLGYDCEKHRSNLVGENKQEYNISHSSRSNDGLPIAIVGFHDPSFPEKNTLDIKSSGGTSRLSPHGTVQEYLNVTGHVYGFATNGITLRLIRDSGRLVKLSYIEFDLRRLLDEDKFSEFTVLYRLIHASRFPSRREDSGQSPIEKYYQESIETGNRIRDGLSLAVKESMVALGNGFLQHPDNTELREKLRNKNITPKQYYDQLRRLVYRLLFLMVTEERDLIYDPEDKTEKTAGQKNIYLKYYSIARLRKLSQKKYLYEKQYIDIWQGLMNTFLLFEEGIKGPKLGIKPLAGDLFSSRAIPNIESCTISNDLLLECLRNLNEFQDKGSKTLVPINYRALDVEELGSVYEGLLELHPVIEHLESSNPTNIRFTFHGGTERKTTGSYYTRPDLVNELIKSALIPVIEERLKEAGDNKDKRINALLSLKVCDAAAGSGHMVLAAARTIAWYMAKTDTGEENPPPANYRHWLREAIQHCIYAVDLNPDAVELCKLSLWLEGHNSGKPISFLDHKIRNGNSLVGVTDLTVLKKGIPTGAYNPITGDDKIVCAELKKQNQRFLKFLEGRRDVGFQKGIEFEPMLETENHFSSAFSEVEKIKQDDITSVKRAKSLFEKLRSEKAWWTDWTACNLWTSAYFFTYSEERKKDVVSSEALDDYLKNPSAALGSMVGKATDLSIEHLFFHWPLEFPDVFDQGGFDAMLGNPPWERIKLQQQEYFATKDADVANAPNAASRNRQIKEMESRNPILFKEYESALHNADATGKFLRESGRCKLTAVGDINTYSIFSELNSALINQKGRMGIIVPTGIATDDSNKAFFGHMVENNRLVSLFDFENREAIFPSVHRSYKFCLLTIAGSDIGTQKSIFGFFLTRVEHLQEKLRIFGLSKEDFLRLNPNTKTCPIFRTSIDAELTTKIYRHVPILINEETGENPWGVKFSTMFHMSNDSHLFRTKAQMEAEGFSLFGNKMKKGDEVWLPLYEAKMIWHYDHRFGSYAGVKDRTSTQMPTPTIEQYQDPAYQILPWYWVNEWDVILKISPLPQELLIAYKTGNGEAMKLLLAYYSFGQYLNTLGDEAKPSLIWECYQHFVDQNTIFRSISPVRFGITDDQHPFINRTNPAMIPAQSIDELQNNESRSSTAWYIIDESKMYKYIHYVRKPEFSILTATEFPRDLDLKEFVGKLIHNTVPKWFIGFRDITNNSNERTFVTSILPYSAVNHKAPIILNNRSSIERLFLYSMVIALTFDYVSRQKLGGTSMTFFNIKQLPAILPKHLSSIIHEILPRSIELLYTSWDIKALVDQVWTEANEEFRGAITQQWETNKYVTEGHTWSPPEWHDQHGLNPTEVIGCPLPPFKWDEERRAVLKAELDAIYAKLYGLTTDELRYILDPQDVYGPDFPGETFRVLKEKEIRLYGEYRTKRLVMEAWGRINN